MGGAKRWKPLRLSTKLRTIRVNLHLSQGGIVKALGVETKIDRRDISAFELGIREPPLPILLEYARLANVIVDVLINDKLELP
jgi:transcriptional regulator with XRE-family HTH domain